MFQRFKFIHQQKLNNTIPCKRLLRALNIVAATAATNPKTLKLTSPVIQNMLPQHNGTIDIRTYESTGRWKHNRDNPTVTKGVKANTIFKNEM